MWLFSILWVLVLMRVVVVRRSFGLMVSSLVVMINQFNFVNKPKFKANFADNTSDTNATFLQNSQIPITIKIFDTKISTTT